jgi:hypothetical protein
MKVIKTFIITLPIVGLMTACGVSNDNESKVIGIEELRSYITDIEITSDNWTDYFDLEDYKCEDHLNMHEYYELGKVIVCKDNIGAEIGFECTYTETCVDEKLYDSETNEDITEQEHEELDIGESGINNKLIQETYILSSSKDYDDPRVLAIYVTKQYLFDSSRLWHQFGQDAAWDERYYEISDLKLDNFTGTVKKYSIPEEKWLYDEKYGKYIIIRSKNNKEYRLYETGELIPYEYYDDVDSFFDDEYPAYGYSSWNDIVDENIPL